MNTAEQKLIQVTSREMNIRAESRRSQERTAESRREQKRT
jgi:hypothetical protein